MPKRFTVPPDLADIEAVARAALASETRRLEQRLAAARRMAVLGTLAAKVAHELNNPLDGITRFVNLAITRVQDDATTHGYLVRCRDGLNDRRRLHGRSGLSRGLNRFRDFLLDGLGGPLLDDRGLRHR